jgi:hypothetical protein
MLINKNIDKHLLDIDKELEKFELLEFKNGIKSLFINSILPSKEQMKILSLTFRIIVDYIIENNEQIKLGFKTTDYIIGYINDNINDVNVDIFRLVYNKESKRIGFNVIISLNESNCTYCLNEKLCIDEVQYYSVDELISKMIILSMDDE